MKKYRKAESKNENFFVRNKKRKVDHVFGDRLHMICSGGAYLNRAWISLFERYGITILQGYGMTECAPVISTNLAWNKKAGSVGKLMPNCAAKVLFGKLSAPTFFTLNAPVFQMVWINIQNFCICLRSLFKVSIV